MNPPKSKDLRKGRISHPGFYYYLTKNIEQRGTSTLIEGENPLILIDRLFLAQKREWWNILAFVVMPDHYHLVIRLGETHTLDQAMAIVNRTVSRQIHKGQENKDRFWQDGFYDRCIRNHEKLNDYVTYVHLNPVRKGLVEYMEDWPYSSAHPEYRDRVKWD